jgi:hypothetical protein
MERIPKLRMHRFADMAADDLHAGPLVHEVRPGTAASRRRTLCCFRGLPALLAQQPEYRKGALGIKQGGEFLGGIHFIHAGGQILSLLSYLSKGEDRERYLGVNIPSAALKLDYVGQARAFANELADRLGYVDRE